MALLLRRLIIVLKSLSLRLFDNKTLLLTLSVVINLRSFLNYLMRVLAGLLINKSKLN